MRNRRPVLRPRLALGLAALAAWGCATPTVLPSGPETRFYFQRELATFERRTPSPFPCHSGVYSASPGGYVYALADWAEQAGLRRGDRLAAIAGILVSGSEDHARALYQVPTGGPLLIQVSRRARTLIVALPCRDDAPHWAATRRLLLAGAQGQWAGCVAAADELRGLRGVEEFVAASDRMFCLKAAGRLGPEEEARLVYEVSRLLIQEARQEPGGLDRDRRLILRNAAWLRAAGASALAADLVAEFERARREASSPRS